MSYAAIGLHTLICALRLMSAAACIRLSISTGENSCSRLFFAHVELIGSAYKNSSCLVEFILLVAVIEVLWLSYVYNQYCVQGRQHLLYYWHQFIPGATKLSRVTMAFVALAFSHVASNI